MKIIKRIRNNKKVFFAPGLFDNFCVYVGDDYGRRDALKDGEYFDYLKSISPDYETDKVYNDFILIYNQTTTKVDIKVKELIDEIVLTYKEEHQEKVEIYLTVMYGGMVAELNKENTMLGKRIKLLGVHQVLKENIDPEVAANYSRNKPWKELDTEMKNKGF